ncbi:WD40 repeat-like protein [Patellaria atrata CBS 101060]|uniref:ASTRA-associated protein 1 n=1 Tax=Patellaria atrata CBS 101060 TaxID=1346257 RepID=A0A9P4SA84_9PEZI|nr:WD40 repeat-like protein [Patellaria atrata CBS 101060]
MSSITHASKRHQPQTQAQTSNLPPAQPTYILRGHNAQIHSLTFLRRNSRLLTGDADGWVVLWGVASKRPVAVWRAHEGSILGIAEWSKDQIITHGRDTTLKVWQLKPSEEDTFSKVLPVDDTAHRKQPWLLHSLRVNTLNFCSFSICSAPSLIIQSLSGYERSAEQTESLNDSALIAVPGAIESNVDIFHLPSEKLLSIVKRPEYGSHADKTQIDTLMSLHLQHLQSTLLLLTAHESGTTTLHLFSASHDWTPLYISTPHTQPILSLCPHPSYSVYYTSAADDIIAVHSIPHDLAHTQTPRVLKTKHHGQQSLVVRSDGRIFATAGWDGRVRVYSTKTLKEVAVLKWHGGAVGAVGFAEILTPDDGDGNTDAEVAGEIERRKPPGAEERRERKAQETHWLGAGGKDGKVSLWEIY